MNVVGEKNDCPIFYTGNLMGFSQNGAEFIEFRESNKSLKLLYFVMYEQAIKN